VADLTAFLTVPGNVEAKARTNQTYVAVVARTFLTSFELHNPFHVQARVEGLSDLSTILPYDLPDKKV
jgi:hypothetical protein